MIFVYFLNGLSFGGLGLAAFFQLRRGGNFPLRHHLPWLALYGLTCGVSSWLDMFLVSNTNPQMGQILTLLRSVSQPLIGLILLIFGWRILNHLTPLPAWTMFIPVFLIVPIAFAIAYASTTFITPSPIEIPIDIWSRYFLYLPGSLMAGIGFIRQWKVQQKLGYSDVASLLLGAGIAFLFEAFVVGLVVPAAPYGPASYYNYDRVITNAFSGEVLTSIQPFSMIAWLDYNSVLSTTGLPIQFWRMLSTFAVTFFMVRGLDVFETIQKREVKKLQSERDQAQQEALEIQLAARQSAENWTDALVNINRQIMNLENADSILIAITENAKTLLHSDFIGLAIFNENKSGLALRYFSNIDGAQNVEGEVLVTNPLILEAVQASRSYRSDGSESEQIKEGISFYNDQAVRSFAIVDLEMDAVPVGALWLGSYAERPYTETDLVWLESMADQVVIAIQHSLMTAQLQTLSVIEERGRIARDMHDGVAQVLGYLNLQLQTLDALWKQDKKESFEHELIQMRQAIQSANADVRESILSLRTTLANDKGVVAAMAEYIEEFGLQTGIDIHFIDHIQGEINLSSIAEVQLVCILQEALANVRKHASASHVEVELTKDIQPEGESILLKVSDDGVGFELRESRRSFGLKTMGERAYSVSGNLKIHSVPAQGTTVVCTLPYLASSKIAHKAKVLS
jgi:signal transduction histidine kinase